MPKSEFYIGSDAFMVVDDGYYGVTGVWRPLFEIQKVMVINVGGIVVKANCLDTHFILYVNLSILLA